MYARKKYLRHLIVGLISIFVGICLTGCSDDEEVIDWNSYRREMAGTWSFCVEDSVGEQFYPPMCLKLDEDGTLEYIYANYDKADTIHGGRHWVRDDEGYIGLWLTNTAMPVGDLMPISKEEGVRKFRWSVYIATFTSISQEEYDNFSITKDYSLESMIGYYRVYKDITTNIYCAIRPDSTFVRTPNRWGWNSIEGKLTVENGQIQPSEYDNVTATFMLVDSLLRVDPSNERPRLYRRITEEEYNEAMKQMY